MTPTLSQFFCGILEANGQRKTIPCPGRLWIKDARNLWSNLVFSEHLPQYLNPTHTHTHTNNLEIFSKQIFRLKLHLLVVVVSCSCGCGFCLGVDGERMPPSQQVFTIVPAPFIARFFGSGDRKPNKNCRRRMSGVSHGYKMGRYLDHPS